jgi:hypothetical protein
MRRQGVDLPEAPTETQRQEQLEPHEVNFVLENDPGLVASLVSRLEDLARDRLAGLERLPVLGVALREAVTNALMHGNLELSSDLCESDAEEYCRLIQQRRAREPYAGRRIFVTARFTSTEATFEIRDEDPGFDSKRALPRPIRATWSEQVGAGCC